MTHSKTRPRTKWIKFTYLKSVSSPHSARICSMGNFGRSTKTGQNVWLGLHTFWFSIVVGKIDFQKRFPVFWRYLYGETGFWRKWTLPIFTQLVITNLWLISMSLSGPTSTLDPTKISTKFNQLKPFQQTYNLHYASVAGLIFARLFHFCLSFYQTFVTVFSSHFSAHLHEWSNFDHRLLYFFLTRNSISRGPKFHSR